MIKQANTLLIVLVSFLFAYWLRFGGTALSQGYLVALLVTLVISSMIFPATGAFRQEFEWAFMRKLRRLIAGWALVVLFLVSIAAMLKITDYYSRIWFGSWVLICGFGLIAMLLLSHAAAVQQRKRGKDRRKIVLVGSGKTAREVEAQIAGDPFAGMALSECFGKPWPGRDTRPLDELAGYIESNGIGEVWIAVPWEDKDLLEDSLAALKESVVDVNVVPDFRQYRLLNQSISEWSGLPVINLSGTPMTGAELRLKAALDWLGALILTLVLSPFLLLVSILIFFTDGSPVIFRQNRHGIGGEPIVTYKFRTMRKDSSEKAFRQAEVNDNRVTWIGRLLRKTSLDELPQLLNVLKGEMSLVGPRPHPVELDDLFKSHIPKFMLRHKVKPGITGWAQVNGYRGRTETREKMALRIEHDLWYIQNWSLWLDLKILLMTPFVMIHRNAY
ncbi:MAG: undecaprenyl-phosphate glucose phosphotransferase [Xanthomonadales bacterium]|nr:undecaprenyl-phosphate glucose phosphotransferase [Gammaproteobacteria bacterium]NND55705.1 undecaprenyl-phosphate glucose phosphotransferase [Xanthomonadales bacterium]